MASFTEFHRAVLDRIPGENWIQKCVSKQKILQKIAAANHPDPPSVLNDLLDGGYIAEVRKQFVRRTPAGDARLVEYTPEQQTEIERNRQRAKDFVALVNDKNIVDYQDDMIMWQINRHSFDNTMYVLGHLRKVIMKLKDENDSLHKTVQ